VTLDLREVRRVVAAALEEDLGRRGDVTSDAVVPADRQAASRLVARQTLILAGSDVAREVFACLDPHVRFEPLASDGQRMAAGESVARVAGSARTLLRGERTALNFLMRMCGIATAARAAVEEIRGTGARILDTRKTAPGLRSLDKYAVTMGGATNHRMGLYDAAMIKDTHLAAVDSLERAVEAVRDTGLPVERITVEVRTVEELERAIRAGAGRALLDNMDPPTLREAVAAGRGRIVLEVSGGLRPGRLRPVAELGVDALSVGWLTHSAPAADLAMEMEA
jgi:nicotinate-nucleotide pyrophosphorylase (carboxylating)